MKRILLVEDHEADSAAIKAAFKRFSLDVQLEHARSTQLAWEMMQCWAIAPGGRRPACILLGQLAGPHDGVWLLERMQEDRRFRQLPVIALSREAGMSDRARSFSNVVGAMERPADELAWRRVISSVARISQALPDLAGA
ncbi:hypothetical protein [Maricaulis sp.]|uniref:hypothetical protein n=1 Tax=Maricaulis sp. TaxID=1486257 RepID=UPI003A90F171|tara:strand:- start:4503 stop:4922 length:420 start_codon:yes stop_codon:yes gene_type:complete